MRIAVPRERKQGECRVAITPDFTRELTESGHSVTIETNAGVLSGFSDKDFRSAGASILPDLEETWKSAELLVKVKEPAPEELQYFRDDLTVFSFLHPAAEQTVTSSLMKSGTTGISYDLLLHEDGRIPILEPMSIIAGKLAIQCGAHALQSDQGGKGVLLGGVVGVKPARVLVIGAGASGGSAARVALGMGAEVTIMDIDTDKLVPFRQSHRLARTVYSSRSTIEREIAEADLVIATVLIRGALAPKLITRSMLPTMKKGSVIVDVCIDQGGCAESSRTTSLSKPVYEEEGVVHYAVPNMPAMVPETSTKALTNATRGWIGKLASLGIEQALNSSAEIRSALTTYHGTVTNKEVSDALSLPFTEYQGS